MAGIAALQYATEGFDTSGRRLMGRQAAGEALLKAWVKYSGADPLTGWVRSRADAEGFARQVTAFGATHQPAIATHGAEKALVDAGALLLAGPQVSASAWHRRHFPQDGWSIVGLTHTTSTHIVMDSIADLLVAPVQPWDALICTSRSVLATVERVLELQQEYLADRMGAAPPARPQLPVIPLGIHCDDFVPREGDRARWRAELGIGPDDIVFLHLARLCFHAKAHPVPAYIALDAAARATGTRPHLVFAGWFEDAIQEEIFRAAAAHFEGSITTHFVDARTDDARRSIRAVADVFTLLVDNIQETFGLSPVEAMAAGLPCVVSDWDGFKDTVQHGVSGFRVPTLQPPPGSGEALVWRWDTEMIRSDHFVGGTAQAIAIDIPAATEAYAALIADAGLRRRMGEAGQRDAHTRFDYRVVIGHYTALFAELETIRRSGTGEVAPRRPGHPARPSRAEPFDAFSSYPTAHLHLHTMLVAGPILAPVGQVPAGFRAAIPVPWAMPKPVDLEAMRLHALATPCTAGSLIEAFGKAEPARTLRGVAWLIKYGYLAPVR